MAKLKMNSSRESRLRSYSFVALIFVCLGVGKADQITLKNGDRVTGSIIKKDGKTITIKTAAFGEINAQWEQVQSVVTDQPVNVELTGGETLKGKLVTEQDKVEVQTTGNETRPLDLTKVAAVRDSESQRAYERLLAPSWTRLWAGTVTFGLAGTQGNAETKTLTAGINAARVTRHDKTTIYMNAIKASALVDGIDAETARAVRGGLAYSRNVTSRFFLNGFNDYEFDRFQNLDLRFVIGGGAGLTVWKFERSRLDLLTGGAFNREAFAATPTTLGFTRHSGEYYVGDDFTLKLNGNVSMYENARFFSNLSNTGEYRFNFDLGANTKLTKWLIWNSSLSNRYLSNPVPGRRSNDFLYSTGLGITFAR